jgi:predicted RNA-binding Zn ribbon-like protein
VSRHLVHGRWLPDAVSGHPALELCNTRAGWGSPRPWEYLVDYPVFALWARETDLIGAAACADVMANAAGEPAAAQAVLGRALRLREALYQALTERNPTALVEVHGFVHAAVARSAYRNGDHRVLLEPAGGLTAPLDAAALAAHAVLTKHGPEAVGRCPGAGCGWLFLDPSRRRRWCIMAVCGNRAKARRHAERQRDTASAGGR